MEKHILWTMPRGVANDTHIMPAEEWRRDVYVGIIMRHVQASTAQRESYAERHMVNNYYRMRVVWRAIGIRAHMARTAQGCHA